MYSLQYNTNFLQNCEFDSMVVDFIQRWKEAPPAARFLEDVDPIMKIRSRVYKSNCTIKKFSVPRNTFPVILKKDIRRYYANMFINVLNSGDLHTATEFLQGYATADVCYVRSIGANGTTGNYVTDRFDGRGGVVAYLAQRHASVPDLCYIPRKAYIKQFAGNDSVLQSVVEAEGSGHLMFQFDDRYFCDRLTKIKSAVENAPLDCDNSIDELDLLFSDCPHKKALQPMHNLRLCSRFVITVNETCRISRIEAIIEQEIVA